MTCECHKINWLARVQNKDKMYTMLDGSPKKPGIDCQDKVNDRKMEMDTYFTVCKYQPGIEGSLFPDEVYQDLMGEYGQTPLDERDHDAIRNNAIRNIPIVCQQQLDWYQPENEAGSEAAIDAYLDENK
jgi:hypothetical protein